MASGLEKSRFVIFCFVLSDRSLMLGPAFKRNCEVIALFSFCRCIGFLDWNGNEPIVMAMPQLSKVFRSHFWRQDTSRPCLVE